jgi:protein SCO1/2
LIVTAGCSAPAAGAADAPVDIRGHLPDLSLSMHSDDGVAVDAGAYRGKVVLLYFGFTRCRDVCPATLARIDAAVGQLGPAGAGVRTLFVSVDPAHDTAAALHAYLAAFPAARAVGLRGDAAATLALAKRCRVAYRPASAGAGAGADAAEPVHGAAVYLFDSAGHARALAAPNVDTPAFTQALRALLAEAA